MEKLKESLEAVLPIIGIVLLLSFTIAPIPAGILMAFLVGAILLVVGMMFFTLGAEIAMTPMGERIGTRIAGSRRLPFIVLLCFTLGFIITVSEPDLQVLAEQVPSIPNNVLIFAVAAGVGIFLVVAVLRMLFGIALYRLLFLFYPVIFILAFFVPADSLAVAFDSGGVTTGPMTVPFSVSTMPKRYMGTGSVSYWPSMAASLVGCSSATTWACMCATGIMSTMHTSVTMAPQRIILVTNSGLRPLRW